MPEWETKMKAIVSESIPEKVTSLTGVPSWMLVLLQNVLKETGKTNISQIWPDAEVYFHGGVSFKPYKKLYHKLIPKNNFRYYEIYNASEGFFGIQDKNDSDELLLMLDYGIFYEFIPFNGYNEDSSKIIPLSEVKEEIASLNADNERILQEARMERDLLLKEARDMKNNIISKAKDQANKEADKILTSTKEQIFNEKMKAITELKNTVADLSIDMATMVLKSELKDTNKQKQLVSEVLKEVEIN